MCIRDSINAVVALTSDLRPAKFLYGTNYSGRQVNEALAVARGQRDWIGRFGGVMLAAMLFIAALSVVYIGSAWREYNPAR